MTTFYDDLETRDAQTRETAQLDGLFVVFSGEVEIRDEHDMPMSLLGARNSFGERGLLRDGVSLTSARALSDTTLLLLPAGEFHAMMNENPAFRRFFNRGRAPKPSKADLATTRVEELMAKTPVTCAPQAWPLGLM